MALTLNRFASAVAVVAFLAIASLVLPKKRDRDVATYPEAERARDLQRRVSLASVRLKALVRRDSVLASLPRHSGTNGPLLALDPRLPDAHRSIITRAVQRQWRLLGLDSAQVPLVVAVVMDTAQAAAQFGSQGTSFDYVVPSAAAGSGDRRCIAITTVRSPELARADRRGFSELFARPNSASQLLGPCAFVARFGPPGAEIDRWLRARSYDLAAYPRWYTLTGPDGWDMAQRWRASNENNPLMDNAWEYSLTREALGCAAGGTHHCAATLPAPPDSARGAVGELVMMTRASDRHWGSLAPRYLSDLVTALGPRDFGRFWQSPLSPDAALNAVAARPLQVWTHEWAVGLIGQQRVGAAVSFADLAGAISLAALSLAIAAWGWSRRQVR